MCAVDSCSLCADYRVKRIDKDGLEATPITSYVASDPRWVKNQQYRLLKPIFRLVQHTIAVSNVSKTYRLILQIKVQYLATEIRSSPIHAG